MRYLTREEELERLIYEKAEACNEKKWVRLKRTYFVLTGVLYLIMLWFIEISDMGDFFGWLVSVPVLAGFILIISYGILYYMITNSMEEEKEIAELKGKYIERKYFINREVK